MRGQRGRNAAGRIAFVLCDYHLQMYINKNKIQHEYIYESVWDFATRKMARAR